MSGTAEWSRRRSWEPGDRLMRNGTSSTPRSIAASKTNDFDKTDLWCWRAAYHFRRAVLSLEFSSLLMLDGLTKPLFGWSWKTVGELGRWSSSFHQQPTVDLSVCRMNPVCFFALDCQTHERRAAVICTRTYDERLDQQVKLPTGLPTGVEPSFKLKHTQSKEWDSWSNLVVWDLSESREASHRRLYKPNITKSVHKGRDQKASIERLPEEGVAFRWSSLSAKDDQITDGFRHGEARDHANNQLFLSEGLFSYKQKLGFHIMRARNN